MLDIERIIQTGILRMDTWDANACKSRLKNADRSAIRDILAEVFEDTVARVLAMYSDESDSSSSVRAIQFFCEEQPPIDRTILNPSRSPNPSAQISVVMGDSIETGRDLKDKGYSPLVHVMADRQGCLMEAKYGAGNQEKDILRRTDLFLHIAPFTKYAYDFGCQYDPEHQYPLERNYGGIYSPDVLVFRGRQRDGFPILDRPFTLDFMSVAGMFSPDVECGKIAPHHVIGVKNKIRTIYRAALHNGNDALVLGAMGCGELGNPPYHTAQLFLEVLDETEFKHHFRQVIFAMKNEWHYLQCKLAVAQHKK